MKKIGIIKAATKLFAELGIDETTTLQIAKEIYITAPLIYYPFNDKDELFERILDETSC